MSLSKKQREALKLVAEGHVQYGVQYPKTARRTGFAGSIGYLLDGQLVPGRMGQTLSSLADRGLIMAAADADESDPGWRVPVLPVQR